MCEWCVELHVTYYDRRWIYIYMHVALLMAVLLAQSICSLFHLAVVVVIVPGPPKDRNKMVELALLTICISYPSDMRTLENLMVILRAVAACGEKEREGGGEQLDIKPKSFVHL